MVRYNKMGISIFLDDEIRFRALCKLNNKKVSKEICDLMNSYFDKEFTKLTKEEKLEFEKIKAEIKKAP